MYSREKIVKKQYNKTTAALVIMLVVDGFPKNIIFNLKILRIVKNIYLNRFKYNIHTVWFHRPTSESDIPEWAIIELQGDLEARDDEDLANLFIGDLYYNKFGQPIMIIGHHMLHGREQKIEKPYAVLEKTKSNDGVSLSETMDAAEVSTLNATVDQTLLDTTAAIENKSVQRTEYKVRALVTKKLLFKSRPKPIIANVPDSV